MISDEKRRETTAELSEKVLRKLRRDFNLVASEVFYNEGGTE